ncbi:hypothetical protein G6F46_013962 [Rhizopus delemar]|nr:hypothetical protein G6F46_013962 [Rhizopus delemar]
MSHATSHCRSTHHERRTCAADWQPVDDRRRARTRRSRSARTRRCRRHAHRLDSLAGATGRAGHAQLVRARAGRAGGACLSLWRPGPGDGAGQPVPGPLRRTG